MPPGDPGIHVTKCGLSKGTTIYMVYGWGSEWFPRYNTFYEMKGVEHAPGGPLWDPWSMFNVPHHKEQEYI